MSQIGHLPCNAVLRSQVIDPLEKHKTRHDLELSLAASYPDPINGLGFLNFFDSLSLSLSGPLLQ